MRRIHYVLPLVIAAAVVAQAKAQYGWYRGAAVGAAYGAYGSGVGIGQGYNYGAAIAGQGQYNKDTSEAMINYEEARSRYIDNSVKWTQAYHERQRIGKAAQAEKYAAMKATRDRYLRNRESGAPPRLGPQQLDPSTGKIYWPEALLSPNFEKPRKQLDEQFVLRAHTGTSIEVSEKIRDLSRTMQDDLKTEIRSMSPNIYLEARKFLDSLSWEGQNAPAT